MWSLGLYLWSDHSTTKWLAVGLFVDAEVSYGFARQQVVWQPAGLVLGLVTVQVFLKGFRVFPALAQTRVVRVIWHKAASLFSHICQLAPMFNPSNTWFRGPTQVHAPNSISITQAIFAGANSHVQWTDTDRPHYVKSSVAVGRIKLVLQCGASCGLWGPWFHFWFRCYIYCLLVYIVCFPTYPFFDTFSLLTSSRTYLFLWE